MKRKIKKVIRFGMIMALGLFLASVLSVLILRFVPVVVTPLMLIRSIEQLSDPEKVVRLKYDWVPLSEISSHVALAVIAAEDQKFTTHNGFDWESIQQARKEIESGKRFRGGSTISNQTAKNVFLWQGRNLFRKGLEAYFTLLIEGIWGKRRIMEVYLNVIEMGEGIYGIEAAAQHYYKKPAKEISRQQAAYIAAVLPNPRRWNPTKPTNYLRGRQSWIVRNMNNLGQVTW
nr:monofunctional biosynthetic peptidoglycan transglycosylase [Cytophagales bacterium]